MTQTTNTRAQLKGRLAELKDAEAVQRLVQYAFRGGKSSKSWTGEEHLVRGERISVEGVRKLIEDADHALLLAEIVEGDKASLVGCVNVQKQDDHAHVGMLAVDPDVQSVGAGKFLMKQAEKHARERFGCDRMVGMVVSGRPELMGWYKRLGYEETGITAPFNPEGNVALIEGLHFVEISKSI